MSGAMMMAGSGAGKLTVTLSAGASQSFTGSTQSHDFGNNIATVTGGSGSYSYSWTKSQDGAGGSIWTLTGAATSTCDVKYGSLPQGFTTNCTVTCTVTDTVTNRTGTAQTAYSGTH